MWIPTVTGQLTKQINELWVPGKMILKIKQTAISHLTPDVNLWDSHACKPADICGNTGTCTHTLTVHTHTHIHTTMETNAQCLNLLEFLHMHLFHLAHSLM